MSNTRQLGYYWCKIKGQGNVWDAIAWTGNQWVVCGAKDCTDEQMIEINENRITTPDEAPSPSGIINFGKPCENKLVYRLPSHSQTRSCDCSPRRADDE